MKKLILLLLALPMMAQTVPPQVKLTGNIGSGGIFPLFNAGTIVMASDADYTLAYPDMSAHILQVTSSVNLTATRNIIGPQVFGFEFVVQNSTTGGQSIIFKTTSAAEPGVTIPNGQTLIVICDGTSYIIAGGGAPSSPFVIYSPGRLNSLSITVPDSGNPSLVSSTGTINIANLFVSGLAGTGVSLLQADANGNVSRSSGVAAGGTVTSVGLTGNPVYNITGSPVTTAGTINIDYKPQASTYALMGPPLGAPATLPAIVQFRVCTPGVVSPLTCTFTSATHAGNLIIVAPARYNPAASAPPSAGTTTDNLGQTYVPTPDYAPNPIFYKQNTAAGVTSISTTATNGGAIGIFEVSNIATTGVAWDADSYNTAQLPGPTILWQALNTANPADFMFAFWTCPVNSTTTPSAGTAWTFGGYSAAPSNGWSYGWVWRNALTTGSYTPDVANANCTQTPTSPNTFAVAFKISLTSTTAIPGFRQITTNDLPSVQWSSLNDPVNNYLTELNMGTGATLIKWNVGATGTTSDWGFGLAWEDTSTVNPACFPYQSPGDVENGCRVQLWPQTFQSGIFPFEADACSSGFTNTCNGFHVSGATGNIVMQANSGISLPNGGQIISKGAITSDTGMSAPSFTVCTTANPCLTPSTFAEPVGTTPTHSPGGHGRAAPANSTPPPTTRAMNGEPLSSYHLHDFSPTLPTNGQVPVFNSTSGLYVPGTISGTVGGLPSTAAVGSVLGVTTANTWVACPPGPLIRGTIMTWSAVGCPSSSAEYPSQIVVTNANLYSAVGTNSISIYGGSDTTGAGVLGNLTLRAADNAGNGANGHAGSVNMRGGDSPNLSSATSTAGGVSVFAGNATVAGGHQGFLQIGQYYFTGTPVTRWNLQQLTSGESTTQDAPTGATQVVGVAQRINTDSLNNTSASTEVISGGEVPVNAPGGATIGHTVCATGPTVVDSGGTNGCSTGFVFGVVTRITGTYTLPNHKGGAAGQSITLSSTLPAVRILSLGGAAPPTTAPVGTTFDTNSIGWTAAQTVTVASAANNIAGAHFRYGLAYDTTFSNIQTFFAAVSATEYVAFAIYDLTASTMVCHSLADVPPAANGIKAFPCVESSPRLIANHDYVELRVSSGTATNIYGGYTAYYGFSRLYSPNMTNCTFTGGAGGAGISCTSAFPALNAGYAAATTHKMFLY